MDLGLNVAAVCISGGAKGIGYTTALAFAREKAGVVVTGRDPTRIDYAVAQLLEECGYMTVKAGLNALSKNMTWTFAKENTLVNGITPGAVATLSP